MDRSNKSATIVIMALAFGITSALPALASKQSDALTRQAAQSLAAQQGLNPGYYDQNYAMQKQAQFWKKNGYPNNNNNNYYYNNGYQNGFINGYPNPYGNRYPNNYYPNQYQNGYIDPYANGYYGARRYHGNQYYGVPQNQDAPYYGANVPVLQNYTGGYYLNNGAQYNGAPYYGTTNGGYNTSGTGGAINAVTRLLTGQ